MWNFINNILKKVHLSKSYAEQLHKKCTSSSTLFCLQNLHILSEMGCLLYHPDSTSCLWALILNFVKLFSLVISGTKSKYGSLWIYDLHKEKVRNLPCSWTVSSFNFADQSAFYIYIFIAIALDETSILIALHFSMQNIYLSCDLGHAVGRSNVNVSQ